MTRSERCRGPLVALASLLMALLSPLVARAAAGDEAAARALFAEGRKLVDEGNYAAACPKFEESLRLDAGVGTKFNLADCLEHVGRTASAWARFLDVAAMTKAAGQTEREQVARARAAALEPGLARLVIQVALPSAGLSVERDGVLVGEASWGMAIPVDPGEHRIEVKAPGKKPWSGVATVPATASTVSVTVPPLDPLPLDVPAPAAPLPAPAPATPAPSTEAARRWSVPIVVLGALGTAALATSVVLAFEVKSKNDEAKGLCPNSSCKTQEEKTRHDTLVEDAQTQRTWAYVGAGVGTAALLSAVYLFWQPFSASAPRPKQALVRPRWRPTAVELEVLW
jgi:hypothetical protein